MWAFSPPSRRARRAGCASAAPRFLVAGNRVQLTRLHKQLARSWFHFNLYFIHSTVSVYVRMFLLQFTYERVGVCWCLRYRLLFLSAARVCVDVCTSWVCVCRVSAFGLLSFSSLDTDRRELRDVLSRHDYISTVILQITDPIAWIKW